MSLIGSLEQFDLANILRRLEVFSKTGLLVVKQGSLWVEFYFRQGQLVCVGPMRANVTLIDRLVQAKLLSSQSLPQVRGLVDPAETNETHLALTLINEGYLSREILRAWASHETSQILQTILGWPAGEIYFEEERSTPADRLLVAVSVSSLLEALPASASAPRPASMGASATNEPVTPVVPDARPSGQLNAAQLVEQSPALTLHAPGTLSASRLLDLSPASAGSGEAAGLLSASQLIDDLPFNPPTGGLNAASFVDDTPPPAIASAASARAIFGPELDISAPNQVSLLPPQPVANPQPPARIDTSFMTPDLVLVPVDLASLREHNPQVQLTPDQWRLFALVDGQASLQMLCQALMASADQVRTVAGELIALGLVMPLPTGGFNELWSTAPAQPSQYAPVQLPTWGVPQSSGPASFVPPIATQSQWGNGNNGATFVVGGGWMLSQQQAASQAQGQPSAAFAPVGGYR